MSASDSIPADLKEPALKVYRAMLLARMFDTKISSLYKAGKITGGVFLGRGHETIAASAAAFLERGVDVIAPFIREQAARCAWGEPILEAARTYLGSVLGCTHGRDSNVHRGYPGEGYLAPISHLGGILSVVAGYLYGKRLDGNNPSSVGVAFAGDGTTSTGAMHEACNLAAIEKLPLVVVVTNNQFAYSTPNDRQFACKSLLDRGKGYGMQTHEIKNGSDLLECLEVMRAAVSAARNGGGPQWVLANTLRMCGHGEHDDASYIPSDVKQAYAKHDPLDMASEFLIKCGLLTAEEDAAWKRQATDEVQSAVAQAQREPEPDPRQEDWIATAWRP